MKTSLLSVFFILFSGFLIAQNRDLNYYIEQAKANSPLINKNINENKLIQLNLQQVNRILSRPVVNVEADVLFAPIISHDNNSNRFEWVSAGANEYTGYDLAISNGGQYQAFVSVTQPLFTGSIYKSFSKKADISNLINENNIALTNHEIEQLVSHQYILCLKSKNQSKISLSLINELGQQLQIMQKLVDNAIYKQTDLLLLQIEYQNYKLQYKTFQTDYKTNLLDLNLFCGINDTNIVDLQETNFELKPNNLTRSKFLTSYKLDSLNIETDQSLYEQKYKPRLNLYANAGMSAIYLPDINRFGFSTGLTFSWNIFDGNQRKIEREKTAVKLQTVKFEKQNFITQFELNKNKYLNRISSVNQKIAVTEKQLKGYDQLLDLYKLELSQAQVSVMDLKNLFKDIAAKKQENMLLKMEKQALINLYNYWNY